MVPVGAMGPVWHGDSPFQTVLGGLWPVFKNESSTRVRASPSEVYPVGKLQ